MLQAVKKEPFVSDATLKVYMEFENNLEETVSGKSMSSYFQSNVLYEDGIVGMAIKNRNQESGMQELYPLDDTIESRDIITRNQFTIELWSKVNDSAESQFADFTVYSSDYDNTHETIHFMHNSTYVVYGIGSRDYLFMSRIDDYMQNNKWTHIALSVYDEKMKLFIDGVAIPNMDDIIAEYVQFDPTYYMRPKHIYISLDAGAVIDNFAVWDGCKYWDNFEPPTTRYSVS